MLKNIDKNILLKMGIVSGSKYVDGYKNYCNFVFDGNSTKYFYEKYNTPTFVRKNDGAFYVHVNFVDVLFPDNVRVVIDLYETTWYNKFDFDNADYIIKLIKYDSVYYRLIAEYLGGVDHYRDNLIENDVLTKVNYELKNDLINELMDIFKFELENIDE